MDSSEARPNLSVVVVCYEMAAQIKNTLQSLLPPYQRNICIDEYEIVLMDNGSAKMLDEETRKISPNLNYVSFHRRGEPEPCGIDDRECPFRALHCFVWMIDGAAFSRRCSGLGKRLLALAPQHGGSSRLASRATVVRRSVMGL